MSSESSSSGGVLTRGTSNGFVVTAITRGWSAEADKLLDYLVRLFDYPGSHTLTCLDAIGERDF